YVWSFGSGVQKIAEKFIKLRYRLLPYIYSQFVESSETGCPVQRPLVYDFQDDPACRQIDKQYMFGSDILVAPILEASSTSRHIYLPEGEWFNVENKKFYKGQKWISFKAKIDSLPWFIKCGSVIPMLKEAPESTMSVDNSSLQLICAVPKTNGEYNSILTEDDGTTVSYKNKEELKTQFLLKVSEKAVSLKSSTSGDSFSNFKRSKIEATFFSRDDIKWELDGKSLKVKSNMICFDNKGESFKLDGRFK
ncbi:MAG: glycoside hydrolase family 31 protein, partial [Lentisphaeraceae bacterium]|nr:glycoside hydrolase family 31 protein [Lentisphaeraceae bacterium]